MNVSRKMRKIGSRDESRVCSQQSVLSAMDRFVLAVDNMNETVMVPSRLMDMSPFDENDSSNNNNNNFNKGSAVDLHAFYTMLNSVKTELIWGAGGSIDVDNNGKRIPPRTTALPARRLSTVSSLSLSDSEPDTESCSESDSGLEFEDQSANIARNFRRHLVGLYDALQQLTDTADVLTCRYQEEVGGAS